MKRILIYLLFHEKVHRETMEPPLFPSGCVVGKGHSYSWMTNRYSRDLPLRSLCVPSSDVARFVRETHDIAKLVLNLLFKKVQ